MESGVAKPTFTKEEKQTDWLCPYCNQPFAKLNPETFRLEWNACEHVIFGAGDKNGCTAGALSEWITEVRKDLGELAHVVLHRSLAFLTFLADPRANLMLKLNDDVLPECYLAAHPEDVKREYFSAILADLRSRGYEHEAQALYNKWKKDGIL